MTDAADSVMETLNQEAAESARPRVGITMGDPAGIGPEVVLKAVAESEVTACCQPVIIGDAQLLAHTARTLDLNCGYDIVRRDEDFPPPSSAPIIFHLNNIHGHIEPGVESGVAGKAAAEYIEAAVGLCGAGNIAAISILRHLCPSVCICGFNSTFPRRSRHFSQTL